MTKTTALTTARADAEPYVPNAARSIISAGHRKITLDCRRGDSASITEFGEGRARLDNWRNLLTGMGTIRDRRDATTFVPDRPLDWRTIEEVYRSDGVARRLIDLPIKEMTRKGWDVAGDTDGKMNLLWRRKGLFQKLVEGLTMGDLYGGALGVIIVDDGNGGDLSKPLRRGSVRKVLGMEVFSRWRTVWSWADAVVDPTTPGYLTPTQYRVYPITGNEITVHASRCIRFEGAWVPERIRLQNLGWADPVYQSIMDQLQMFAKVYNNVERITDAFVEQVYKVPDLETKISTDSGTNALLKFLDRADLMSSVYHTKVIDSLMEYVKLSSNVSGLSDIMDRNAYLVCAVRGIPHTLFMGASPGGLNATGESDTRGWYDSLAGEQETKMADPIGRINDLLVLSKEDETGPVKEGAKVQFRSLWQLTELDQARVREIMSRADLNYAQMLDAEGVAQLLKSRFGGDAYSLDTRLTVTPESVRAPGQAPAAEPDDDEAAAQAGDKPPAKKPKPKDDKAKKEGGEA